MMLGHRFIRVASLFLGAGLAAAQSVSTDCQNTLLAVAASPEAACLNPSVLMNFALAANTTQPSFADIMSMMNTWLNGICTTGACTDDNLATVFNKISSGCNQDTTSNGVSTTDVASAVQQVTQVYPTVRKVMCLRDTSANQFCIPKTLSSVESVFEKLASSNSTSLQDIMDQFTANLQPLVCNDCVKAGFNIVTTDFPNLRDANTTAFLQGACGASFTDNSMPAEISQTAAAGVFVAKAKSGAIRRTYVAGWVTLVAGVFGIIAL
ncbi:hypothetical protein C8J56DRAFT_1168830 [Mycena floridula]|nr:hypothetical protein C8J56DRAFT_1168830 [Mycena floridula]